MTLRKRMAASALMLFFAFALFLARRDRAPVYAQTSSFKTFADLTGTGAAQAFSMNWTCTSVQLGTLSGNAAAVRFGDASVSATQGMPLAAGASPPVVVFPYAINLNTLYFYAGSGDKLSVTCMR